MALLLYAHPFSSYCQKALIALYENATPFRTRLLDHTDAAVLAEWAALWPLKRMPILVDNGKMVPEASIIIEYLGLHYPGPVKLVPSDRVAALEVRQLDRFFDNDIQTPLQKIVFDARCPAEQRDPYGVTAARDRLEIAYRWLDRHLANRVWVAGSEFSLADCAAAPALFYADWTHRIDPTFEHVHAYRQRLLARPSFARAVDEARPFRKLFPLGAPDRD